MKNTYIRRNKTGISGFTLIEILIVVAMLGIMLTATYAPYSHYQKKALLKQWKKEIVQSIYEARNLAINGLNFGTWALTDYENISVGLYMDTSDTLKNKITYFSYPHTFSGTTLWDPVLFSTDRIIKTKDLPNSIELEKIKWSDKFMFLYDAINGVWRYYEASGAGLSEMSDSEVDVKISYKGATTPTLQWDITYYTNTYIADY